MFGMTKFRPWVGREYEQTRSKLLVLGESRYDNPFTDYQIIKSRLSGGFDGGQLRTFVKFERAILGLNCSPASVRVFWHRTLFYNYNTEFFPGGPRINLPYERREHHENSLTLRRVLQKYGPKHVIVWGLKNWDSVDAHSLWKDYRIPRSREPYCSTTIDGQTMLFTRVKHPSTGFSPLYWHKVLTRFLTSTA